MVAEAVQEAPVEKTQVPQPEVEAPPSPPAPDTPEVEQEAPASEEPTAESALEEFKRSRGATEDSPAGTERGEHPLSAEAQAEVDRYEAEKAEADKEAQQKTGVFNKFRDATNDLRTWGQAVGLPQNQIEGLLQYFVNYHGLSGEVHRTEAKSAQATETLQGVYTELAKLLPPKSRQGFLDAYSNGGHLNYKDTSKAFGEAFMAGYVSAKDSKKATDDAVDEYHAHLIAKKLLKGHDAPPVESGAGSANSASDNAKLINPDTPLPELEAILARQKRAEG